MHLMAGRRMGDAIACTVSGTQVLLPFPVSYRTRVADGEPVTIGLRPEHVRLTSAEEAPGLPCTVEMVELSVSDAAHIVHLRHRDHAFCAKVALPQPVRPRETVWMHFSPQHLYYFDRDDKRL
jgi:multiple sugar transport system ATP-binding protein